MTELKDDGLFLIEDEEVTHIHTTAGYKDIDALREYLDEWDIDV